MAYSIDDLCKNKEKSKDKQDNWCKTKPKKRCRPLVRIKDALGVLIGLYDAIYWKR